MLRSVLWLVASIFAGGAWGQAATTTSLASSVNPTFVGQNTTLTASVSGTSPTGTVTFKDGTTTLGTGTLSSGQATLVKNFSTTGSHSLTASYGGDGANAGSVSAAVAQVVNAKSTTTATLAASPTTVFAGQATTMTATIAGSSPTGTVTFKDGATTLGSATLSGGVATLAKSFTSAGVHSLTAVYAGDVGNSGSTSAAIAETVNAKTATATTLSSTINPAFVSQNTTLTATVTGSNPSGTVTFKDGATTLGTGTLNSGVATLVKSFTATGTHSLTAVYGGDTPNSGSTSAAVVETVNAKVVTTTTLASSVNPAFAHQNTTLTATVAGGNPTGTVTFKDGTTTLGTGTLSGGVATLVKNFTTTGTHSLTAVYAGDVGNLTSTSSAVSETINAQTIATNTLTASPSPAGAGQIVTLTSVVTGTSPTGTVIFSDGATTLNTATLALGTATFSTSFTVLGSRALKAAYSGDAANAASSKTLSLTVNKAVPVLSLTASQNPASINQAITLTASVAGSTPTGTVTFNDGAIVLGTDVLTSGTTAISVDFDAPGIHNLTVSYSGDALNNTATSTALPVQVGAAGGGPVSPGNMTWLFGYDPEGNRTVVSDPNGNVTGSTYDKLKRMTTVVQPAPAASGPTPTITLAYDAQDNLASVKDPRNLSTIYTLDGLSNTTKQVSPDTGTSNATYDAAGNLLTQIDARSKTTTYTYDVLNRVKTISFPTGTGTTFEYDGGAAPYPGSIGHLTKLTDESGVTTFGYDSLGRLISRSALVGAKTLTTAYAWGTTGIATGKITSITYPSGARANYSYDTAGRVQALTVNPPNSNGIGTNTGAYLNILSGITYNADNNPLGWTWADNAPYQRTYDSFGRLSSFPIGYPLGTGTAAGLTRTLAYDNAARITGYSHSNASGAQAAFNQSFGYDGLDRLTQQTTSALTYGYSYDATGNRTTLTLGANTYTNTVSLTSNRLTVVQTAGTGGVPVNNNQTYTNSGSLTADGTATYAYSDRGRMSSSTVSGSTTTYKYNGLEQRVSKTGTLVPTGAAYFAYDEDGKTLGEYDNNLYPVAETIYIGTTPVAVLKETGTAGTSTIQINVGNVYADQIDTPRVITRNSDEAILWRWDATEAFGNSTPNENPSALGAYRYDQRTPGQVYDLETQNFYNLNRDYQTRTGRYVQSDPIGLAGGVNTYAYVGSGPLRHYDPYGLYSWDDFIDDSANFSAGWGDTLSFGITARIREGFDIGSVNKCTWVYRGGEAFGFANGLALGWVQGARATARAATEASLGYKWSNFSHSFIPKNLLKKIDDPLAEWLNGVGNRLNGDYVTPMLHTRMDAEAQFGLSAEWLKANPLFSPVRQLWNRVPYVPGAAIYGTESAAINSCSCSE